PRMKQMSSSTVAPMLVDFYPVEPTNPISDAVSFFVSEPQNLPGIERAGLWVSETSQNTWADTSLRDLGIADLSRLVFECKFGESLKRLDELETLESDWDSFGSEPPSIFALLVARHLVSNIASTLRDTADTDAVPFFIGPLSGGGLQVEWRGSVAAIEV